MTEKILVAYATRYGSTREIAQAIAERLGQAGADVKVENVRDVRSLDGFDRVVLGMPLYIGSFLKDGKAFLGRHQQALQSKPVHIFAPGPLLPDELAEEGDSQLKAALEKEAPWLQPASAREFIGKYDPAALRGADKMLTWMPASPLKGRPATDNRDWAAIQAWADELAAAAPAART